MPKLNVGLFAIVLKLGPKIGSIALKLFKGIKFGKVGFAAASFVGVFIRVYLAVRPADFVHVVCS